MKNLDEDQKKAKESFLRRIKKNKKTGCWRWLGENNKRYGTMYLGKKHVYAHRFSYEIYRAKIPEGFQIDHLCRNTFCVNPKHLEAVTPRTNVFRSSGKLFKPKELFLVQCVCDKKNIQTKKCKKCWERRDKRRALRKIKLKITSSLI